MFWILFGSIALVMTAYLTLRLTGGMGWHPATRVFIGAVLFGMAVSPYLSRKIMPFFESQEIRYWISMLAYLPIIMLMMLFCLSVLRDLIWMPLSLVSGNHFSAVNPALLRLSNLIFIGVTLLLTGLSVVEGLKPPKVKEITLASDKISTPMRLVLLSDIHLNPLTPKRHIETMVRDTNNLKPDAVLITGDIIDGGADELAAYIPLLKQLHAPKGVFATLGNHEFYIGLQRSLDFMKAADMTHLFNSGVRLSPEVYLGGVPDHKSLARLKLEGIEADARKALAGARETDYKILMSHQPPFIDTVPKNTLDLQVSGHTHGGHLFPLHLLIRLANGYVSGLYRTPNGMLYVSPGTYQWGPMMRLGSEKEITLIKLVPSTP